MRGCTLSCTHCSRSAAKRWGSVARSQASWREQLWAGAWAWVRGQRSPRPPHTPSSPGPLGLLTRQLMGHPPPPTGPRGASTRPGPPDSLRGHLGQTHMLCRTHQPQWGSRDPRHSSHDVYCTQLSTGTRVTWRRSMDVSPRPPGPRSPLLGPFFCLVPSRVTPVPPESGHTDLPLCRQQRAREMALSTQESASPSCPAAPRHSQGSHGP